MIYTINKFKVGDLVRTDAEWYGKGISRNDLFVVLSEVTDLSADNGKYNEYRHIVLYHFKTFKTVEVYGGSHWDENEVIRFVS